MRIKLRGDENHCPSYTTAFLALNQSQFRGSPLALVLDEQGGLWKTRYGMFEDANLQRQGLKPVWVRFKAPPDLAASTRSCQLCTSCKLPLRTPASAPSPRVLADACPSALPAQTPLPIVLADARPSALPASAPSPRMVADACSSTYLAQALFLIVLTLLRLPHSCDWSYIAST